MTIVMRSLIRRISRQKQRGEIDVRRREHLRLRSRERSDTGSARSTMASISLRGAASPSAVPWTLDDGELAGGDQVEVHAGRAVFGVDEVERVPFFELADADRGDLSRSTGRVSWPAR